jgi:hypothetical protein
MLVASFTVLVIVGLLGVLGISNTYFGFPVQSFFMTYCGGVVVLLLALILTSRQCRKRYSNKRFLLLMLMWLMSIQILFSFVAAFLGWGYAIFLQYFIWVVIISVSQGVILYITSLPFWILAYSNKIYNQRFVNCLKLPEKI